MNADPFDALTDLFLGDLSPNHAAAPKESAPPPRRMPIAATAAPTRGIELVVAAHLPVMPGAWISQYARSTADTTGSTVSLIRISRDHLRVELFTPSGVGGAQAATRHVASQAVEYACLKSGRVLLRIDETVRAELTRAFASATILTGAEESGIIAAYQALKDLAACPAVSRDQTLFGVSVVGCSEQSAAEAVKRLSDAATTFLDLRLHAKKSLGSIESTRCSHVVFDGPLDLPAQQTIALLESTRPPSPEAVPGHVPVDLRAGHTPAVTLRSAPEINDPRSIRGPVPDLASQIPGMDAQSFRCPMAEAVQFGLDSTGRLHALVLADSQPDAVALLVAATAWAKTNAATLGLICPRIVARKDSPPALHVFTAEPARFRGLLDSDLHVHLLSRAEVVVRDGWVCHALN